MLSNSGVNGKAFISEVATMEEFLVNVVSTSCSRSNASRTAPILSLIPFVVNISEPVQTQLIGLVLSIVLVGESEERPSLSETIHQLREHQFECDGYPSGITNQLREYHSECDGSSEREAFRTCLKIHASNGIAFGDPHSTILLLITVNKATTSHSKRQTLSLKTTPLSQLSILPNPSPIPLDQKLLHRRIIMMTQTCTRR
ncbi:hypothetical protein RJT34_16050 [Clitoria ternatea]|uniref:Uncharacterized protein n=1 Tax=Clitoria ternatea TaxID=43366 RepID=A0AAN9J8H6_CLITE